MSTKSPDSQAIQVPEIAIELQNQIKAIRALATCYNLLEKAPLPHSHHIAVAESLNFLRSLHSQALEQAASHPDSDKVPEIKAAKEQAELQKEQLKGE